MGSRPPTIWYVAIAFWFFTMGMCLGLFLGERGMDAIYKACVQTER